jgi:hypothetical protein
MDTTGGGRGGGGVFAGKYSPCSLQGIALQINHYQHRTGFVNEKSLPVK